MVDVPVDFIWRFTVHAAIKILRKWLTLLQKVSA